MDLINVEGWIPREQILGLEARSKVRKECQNGQCKVKLNLMKLNTLILPIETKAILPKSDFLMQIKKQSMCVASSKSLIQSHFLYFIA